MNTADTPDENDDAIPLLTDVIEAPGALAEPQVPSVEDALADRLRQDVLERLRSPETGLEAELMAHLRPTVDRTTRRFAAELAAQIQATLAYVTESVIDRAVADALAARERARAEPGPQDAEAPAGPEPSPPG